MIIPGKNGRRHSVFTVDEAANETRGMISVLSEDERALLKVFMTESHENLIQLEKEIEDHCYVRRPVSMEQFLEDPYYFGDSCANIFSAIKEDLLLLFERPYRETLLCLHPDTRIPLSNGTSRPIKDLILDWDRDQKPIGVYSVDTDGKVVLSMAEQIRYTGEDYYYRVSLDDGSSFVCNSRHQMIMTDGSKRMAGDMSLGDMIMPFYGGGCVGAIASRRLSDGCSVASIQPEGYGPVCCMTVPSNGNFAIVTSGNESTGLGVFSSNTGAIGLGKSYAGSIIIGRILYEMSCMIDPQKTFGIEANSEISIPMISKNMSLAKRVLKFAVDSKVLNSPYFMTHFTPKISQEVTAFPGNIKLIASSYVSDHTTGTNVMTAFLDEVNFPPKRHGQHINTGFGVKKDISHFDIVEKVYGTIYRRIESRFQKAGGRFPGMIILASSAATVDSFTERKIRKSMNDPNVFVRDHTKWTSNPSEYKGEGVFYVLCSHSALMAKILSDDEVEKITEEYLDANDAWIMDIPMRFKGDFELDIEEALREIGGVSTQAMSLYIQRPRKVMEAIATDRMHPFSKEEWISGSPGQFIWDMMVREFERRLPGGYMEKAYAPIRNPEAMRWCHIDVSISGDCTGFCVGHIERWVEVVRKGSGGERFKDIAPYYVIDVMMRIIPPPGEQIYMPDLRQLIYQMMDHGYKFVGFSSDTYMYVEMHQQLARKGITPHILSMDRTTEPYDELKSAFYENRIEIYNYAPFIDEFKKLEYDRVVGKIDHTQGESKDVCDAVGGCVGSLKLSASRMPLYADISKKREAGNEHGWVSPLLVNTEENREMMKQLSDGDALEVMPIIFGDDF